MATLYIKYALTGGGTEALDGIDGANLYDQDMAFVYQNETLFFYKLDQDSGASESVPRVIAPDANAGDKRWVLQDMQTSALVTLKRVDANSIGYAAALRVASDGNLEEADASGASTMPCLFLALETGTGTKRVLSMGRIENSAWSWTPGEFVYVSPSTPGELTQSKPSGTGQIVQVVGVAESATALIFNPSYVTVELA